MRTQDFSYLIIGAGRWAQHLQFYLNDLGVAFATWDRQQDPHALQRKVSASTHVLLAISDSAIEPFYQRYLAGQDKVVVHFSGALHIEGLICTHPLMTFGPELYPADFYPQIHFTLTGAQSLQEVLPFKNSYSVLSPQDKALYHALCVVGGNFTQILFAEVFTQMKALHVPAPGVQLYFEKSLENAAKLGIKGLTGPLQRNDQITMNKNLAALEGQKLESIYRVFLETYRNTLPKETL